MIIRIVILIIAALVWVWANQKVKGLTPGDFGPQGAIVYEAIKLIAIIVFIVFAILVIVKLF